MFYKDVIGISPVPGKFSSQCGLIAYQDQVVIVFPCRHYDSVDHYLRRPVTVALGREDGAPPPVDLIEERENGDFVRALILDRTATAAHDLSDGGLAIALAEMAMAAGIGAALDDAPDDIPAHAYWFGEDQARYLHSLQCDVIQGYLISRPLPTDEMTHFLQSFRPS